YISARAEATKGRALGAEDLRLEIRRKGQTLFTLEEQKRHAALLEDSERTQDVDERQALEKFEAGLMERLRKGDISKRFESLTIEEMKTELARSVNRYFRAEDRDLHHELMARQALLQRRIARLKPQTLSVVNVPGPPSGPGLPL